MILSALLHLLFLIRILHTRYHCRFYLILLLIGDAVCLLLRRYDLVCLLPLFLHAWQVDCRQYEIPDLCCVCLALFGLYRFGFRHLPFVLGILAAGCLLCRKGKLGFGDVKYTAAFAFYAGIQFLLSTAAASGLCLAAAVMKKGSRTARIPFAPYLSIGFMLVLLLSVPAGS